VLEEDAAVRAAVTRSQKDDLVVLMVDKPSESWKLLNTLTGSYFDE
jgi:hypothetical protein